MALNGQSGRSFFSVPLAAKSSPKKAEFVIFRFNVKNGVSSGHVTIPLPRVKAKKVSSTQTSIIQKNNCLFLLWKPGTWQWFQEWLESRRHSHKKRRFMRQAINLAPPEGPMRFKGNRSQPLDANAGPPRNPHQTASTDCHWSKDTPDLFCVPGNTASRTISQPSGPSCNSIHWSCVTLCPCRGFGI